MACRKQMSRPQQAIMYASIYHSMDDKKAPPVPCTEAMFHCIIVQQFAIAISSPR